MKYAIFIIIIAGLLFAGYSLFTQKNPTNIDNNEPANSEESGNNEPSANEKPLISGKKLDLSNQGLEKIPEYVFSETSLEELDVSGNKLTGAIQAEIRHLQNLRVLNLSNNIMTGVPAEIGQLRKLEILDLSNNQLTGLPYELGNLKNLKIFNISGNNYSELDLGIIEKNLSAGVNIVK